MEPLTGAPADAYVSAWMESSRSGRPLNAAAIRRDAIDAARSSRALARLRLASARIGARVFFAPLPPARPARARRRGFRAKGRQARRTAPGAPSRLRREP